ncbi:MAG: hypothetical protein II821_10265 [Treponema sp.]|nr:hypothetical protein [Treponema sp.]
MIDSLNLASEIFSRYGAVKRARKCFLYTEKGVRLTDMYQEGGRAILGWGGSVFTVLKDVLERGITGSYYTSFSSPCGRERSQLERAVAELFGDERRVFIFSSEAEAIEHASTISPESISFYRPWNPAQVEWQNVACIVFAPPLPWTNDIFILAVKNDIFQSVLEKNKKYDIPESALTDQRFLSSPLCAAVTRSIYDLIKAIQEREAKDWFIYDQIITKYWERKGPYLFPKISPKEYPDFVRHCLDCHLVISPVMHIPSVVPFGADKGNFTLLKNNPFKV